MATSGASTSGATGGGPSVITMDIEEDDETTKQWPWIYKPAEFDPEEVKDQYDVLLYDDEKFAAIDFEDSYEASVEKFFHHVTGPLQTLTGNGKIEISYPRSVADKYIPGYLRLPKFIAEVAPRRKVVQAGDDPRGSTIEPIPGVDIRYACIAPEQTQPGVTVVMLSIWIKPPEGYKSEEYKKEKKMNKNYAIKTFPRNEEWVISNLYLGIKGVEEALLLINAVSRLVYESNKLNADDRRSWRVQKMRLTLGGYLDICEVSVDDRDKIDLERLELEPSEDSDSDTHPEANDSDSHDDERTKEKKRRRRKRRALREEEAQRKVTGAPLPLTETEKTLVPKSWYLILDEEQLSFYEGPYCEHPFRDLRLYQNQTDQAIDNIFVCKKTGHIEVQKDETIYIIRNVKDSECFKKLKGLIDERKIKAKPKNVFTCPLRYKEYHEAMSIKLTTTDQVKEYQRKLLEKLDAQNKTFAESLGEGGGGPMPPGFNQDPPPPDPKRNWIRLLLTGQHTENADKSIFTKEAVAELSNILAKSKIEPANVPEIELTGEDGLKKLLDQIHGDLLSKKFKQAAAKLKTARESYGGDILSSVSGVPDITLLERIAFLPDK